MKIKNYYAMQSYTLDSDLTKAQISIYGGNVTAQFDLDGKKVEPFFIAPWWADDREALLGTCEYSLRGIFFCFPFGVSAGTDDSIDRPCHGFTSSRNWDLVKEYSDGKSSTVELAMHIPEENADVTQKVTVCDGQNVLYISNTVSGTVGKYPLGYHPTLRMPEALGSAILDMSPYKECWTSPTHIDAPENGGYCSLVTDYEITDEENVPTVYGKNVNLKKHPFIKGFDDIYMYVYDTSEEFNYAALSIPSEGYLYYQIKNPKQLSNSMIWTSYAGRHFPLWNSRVNGCIEIGAATNYFFYGLPGAQKDDPLTEKGYTMYHELDGSERTYKLVCGVVKIPADYKGVSSIVRKDENTIIINGKDGSVIETACSIDFLK